MASSITSTATFTLTNMKPAGGEQIDALWADNIADNSGYVYYRDFPGPAFYLGFMVDTDLSSTPAFGSFTGTRYFKKMPEHNYLVGSWASSKWGDTTSSVPHSLFVDGTTVINNVNLGAAATSSSSGSFIKSISHLANGTFFAVVERIFLTQNVLATTLVNYSSNSWFTP